MIVLDFNQPKKARSNKGIYGDIRKNDRVPYGDFSKYANITCVYSIYNNITKKEYIGSTKNLQQRVAKHFNELFHNRHTNKNLQIDFNSYGYNSFKINILLKCDSNSLLENEIKFQKERDINSLYNEKITGVYMTEKYRQQLGSTSKAKHKTQEFRNKISKLKTNKIGQYDLAMNLIKIWDSAIQVCDILGYTRSVILSCCNRSKKRAYGFNWRYVDDNGNIVLNGYEKARK